VSANGLQVVLCDGRCCCYCSTHVSFATFYAKSGRHFFSSTLSSFDHFDASFPVDLWTSVTVSRRRFMTATIGRVSDKTVSDGRTSSHAFCMSSERKQTSAAVCLSVCPADHAPSSRSTLQQQPTTTVFTQRREMRTAAMPAAYFSTRSRRSICSL